MIRSSRYLLAALLLLAFSSAALAEEPTLDPDATPAPTGTAPAPASTAPAPSDDAPSLPPKAAPTPAVVGASVGAADAPPPIIPNAQPSVTVRTRHVTARLLSDHYILQPGEPVRLGLELTMEEGWHIYWKNPGDVGQAARFKLKLPEGYTHTPLTWPVPRRVTEREIDGDPTMINGYKGTVLFNTTVEVPEDATPGTTVPFTLDAEWLVCEDSCVRGGGENLITLKMTVVAPEDAEPPPEDWAEPFTTAARGHAGPPPEGFTLESAFDSPALVVGEQTRVSFLLSPPEGTTLKPPAGKYAHPLFLEPAQGVIERDRPRATMLPDGRFRVIQSLEGHTGLAAGEPAELRGILQVGVKGQKAPLNIDLSIDLPTAPTEETTAAAEAAVDSAFFSGDEPAGALPTPQDNRQSIPFWTLLALALLGGLILNIMPCVLPVLSLKALKVVELNKKTPGVARTNAVAYLMGILISFWVLAGALSVAKLAGQKAGWGFQMQDPTFITFLAAVVFGFSLSLLGVFDIPGVTVSGSTESDSLRGSFVEGVLTTLLSTPCSAPFLGPAIAYALSQSTSWIFFTFSIVGIGLALPMVLVSIIPAFQKVIPRPGAWMDTFKHLVGFLLVATTVWLLSTLASQTSALGLVGVIALLTAIGFAGWILGTFSGPLHPPARRFATFCFAAITVFIGTRFVDFENNASAAPVSLESELIAWQPFQGAESIALADQGHTVFLDFTASWCVTCKVNEANAIETQAVSKLIRDNRVVAVKADWSNYDEEIGAWINHFGKAALPLYVILPANKMDSPIILDELISEDDVLTALRDAGPSDADATPISSAPAKTPAEPAPAQDKGATPPKAAAEPRSAEPAASGAAEASPAKKGLAWRDDYEAAIADARAAGKPVLIDFTADWCEPCQRLAKITFADPKVQAAMNRFVLIKIDDSEGLDENIPIMEAHGVLNLPHIAFIDSEGQKLDQPHVKKFVEPAEILPVLGAVK